MAEAIQALEGPLTILAWGLAIGAALWGLSKLEDSL
jgi:hypothetical protein